MSDQNTILPDILTDETKIFILSADAITYICNKDIFILYLWSLWWRVFWKFLVISFSSEKKLCFKIQEINKQTQMKWFLFLKKKIIWIDKLKFKNISIILFQGWSMYEQNTCKNTWKKAVKRKQNFQKLCKIIK